MNAEKEIEEYRQACRELGAALLDAIEKALHPVLGRIFGSKAITNINRNIEVLKNLINR